MTITEEFEQFIVNIQTMPRDELAAWVSIMIGLCLVLLALILW